MFCYLVDITYKWETYSNKWQWDLLWNVEPFSRPFLVLFSAYKSFQIFSFIFKEGKSCASIRGWK